MPEPGRVLTREQVEAIVSPIRDVPEVLLDETEDALLALARSHEQLRADSEANRAIVEAADQEALAEKLPIAREACDVAARWIHARLFGIRPSHEARVAIEAVREFLALLGSQNEKKEER